MLGSGQTQNVTVASLCEQKKTKVVPGSLFQSLLEMFLFIVKGKEASSTCLKMADRVTATLVPVLDLLTHCVRQNIYLEATLRGFLALQMSYVSYL